MAIIRVRDDGRMHNVREGYQPPYQDGEYLVYDDIPNAVASHWNDLTDEQRKEIQRRARKEHRDIREVLESLI